MKKGKIDIGFDDVIGIEKPRELTKKEHDNIREYRRNIYKKRASQDKLDDILTGFRFTLSNYAEKENPKDIILLGQFFDSLFSQINIKKGRFAEYIEISSGNINKYFSGERKFNIDHVLKLEKMFSVHAETFLEIQIKNDLLKAKSSHKGKYDNYKLEDLISD